MGSHRNLAYALMPDRRSAKADGCALGATVTEPASPSSLT